VAITALHGSLASEFLCVWRLVLGVMAASVEYININDSPVS